MIIVPASRIFLNKGAVVFERKELETIIHALIEEGAKVSAAGGNQYCCLSLEELIILISQLRQYEQGG